VVAAAGGLLRGAGPAPETRQADRPATQAYSAGHAAGAAGRGGPEAGGASE